MYSVQKSSNKSQTRSSTRTSNPAHQADVEADRGRCMITACCCSYTAWDCNNILCLTKGASDCLCFRSSCCLAVNTPDKGCGCTTDKNRGECCKLGCYCMDYALVYPTKCCAQASQCLCCYQVASFPCSPEYVPTCVCVICCPGLQVAPNCGCCVAPPPCPALDKVLRDEQLAPLTQTIEGRGAGASAPPKAAEAVAVAVAAPVAAAGAVAVTTSSAKKKKKKDKDDGGDGNDGGGSEVTESKMKKKKKKEKEDAEAGDGGDDAEKKKKKKKKKPKAEVY